jgi:flagellar protein FliS
MNPLNAYRETKVKTAGQGRLIVMLYDEAIKQIDLAADALKEGVRRYDAVNNALVRAQAVVAELMSSLNFERGGEIAQNLFSLYTYFNSQLLEANLRKDAAPLAPVRVFLSELRIAWEEISKTAQVETPAAERSLNVAG